MSLNNTSISTNENLQSIKRYSGRVFSERELVSIRELIARHPGSSRAELSRLTCKAVQWFKVNGGLKEMSCRVAMLRMQEDGLIQLPAPRCKRPESRIIFTVNTAPEAEIELPAHRLTPLQLCPVVNKTQSRLWNEYIHRYHYLGHKALPGAQLRYFVMSGSRTLSLLSFSASAWQVAARDNHIGWCHNQRKKNLHLVVNNSRFLILPWIKSKNLASMILALAARQLPSQWEECYHYKPVLLETFVEKYRFKGTCYQAANWVHVGKTKGRGKLGPAGKQSVPIKDLWLYPLTKDFRSVLTQ
ncbi:MAG: DUF4338 domain-containing protein [Aestuariibacter sp.]|nr:DUF4338 domain-containing protein [Aestuariibacter sp.]